MWKKLNLVRVYTKPIGDNPNLNEPVVLRKGATILDICRSVHKEFEQEFKCICFFKIFVLPFIFLFI